MGSIPCRNTSLLGIAHLVMGKYFQALEVHRGMEHIQDLRGEEKARCDFAFIFCKFLVENLVSLCAQRKEL